MLTHIQNKKVLFITTKNLDYIRNTQELTIINEYAASYQVIGSTKKSYPARLLYVYWKLLITNCRKFDTVFIGFAPQLILPFFSFKFKQIYIIEDFFISLYDTLCHDRKKARPNSFIGKLLHTLDSRTLHKADLVITDTNAHANYFREEFGANISKMHTLYLQADRSIYYPMQLVKPSHLTDKYIVLYFGSILPLQGIEVVLEAMEQLKDHSNIYFYCIGPIQPPKLDKPLPQAENIEYIDWLPQKKLATYIAQADLCLAGHFHPTIEKARRTIPGKAYIYQAMKKPMILGDNPATRELFANDPTVTFVEMGNSDDLVNKIEQHFKKTMFLQ